MNKDIKALRERLQQLETQHAKGSIARKAYEAAKAKLRQERLAKILTESQQKTQTAQQEAQTQQPAQQGLVGAAHASGASGGPAAGAASASGSCSCA